MELLFSFQAMERNGDVVAEINNCSSPNSSLISKRFNIGAYKMCKDDISSPLFCSASNCLRKSIMMGSKEKTDRTFLSSDDKLFYNAQRTDEYKLPAFDKSINSSANSFNSPLSSPSWENPPKLQSFTGVGTEKKCIQDTFLNGSKLQLSSSNLSFRDNNSDSRAKSPEVNLLCSETIDDKLLLDYEAETSSSSIEEVYYSMESQKSKILSSPEEIDQPTKKCKLSKEHCMPRESIAHGESKNRSPTPFEVDSNHNVKIDPKGNNNPLNFSSFFSPGLAEKEPEEKRESNSEVKKERIMPELSPPLICLDDEDSLVPEISKKCEVIDVADSPEMPILIPFTSEVDEAIRIKTEALSDSEKDKNSDSDSIDPIRQPKVCLQRMMFNHSSESQEKRLSISSVSMAMYRNAMNNGPEIEEIEGVRFFQFRSKQDMEEFNRNTERYEIDEDMIVPTKTMDITQIKGWRTKYFAPESQFQNQPCQIDAANGEDLSADNKNPADHEDGDQNNSGSDKKENDPPDSENFKPTSNNDSGSSGKETLENSPVKTDGNEEKILIKNIKEEKEDIKNPMSAFVSEELDRYLKDSSTLNVSELQKINPNILPISPNASILSIGKLRKDDRKFNAIQVFKRRREIYGEDYVIPININDSPGSPSVITLGSSEDSSCEEDIPVAKLRSKKRPCKKRSLGSRAIKRKNSDSEFDQSGKRLVLRLTKEGGGVSKGYKISDISCKEEEQVEEFAPPSPNSMYDICKTIKMPDDGSLPVIKKTLFSKDNEPHLLEEFLNNLNMYGTRKDVAMLVQSNQSYFDGGPAINSKKCTKAISVLFTNKVFLEMKQKSKKKKMKTWQKYLPKKLSNKQKLKLTKRKTRVQKLLEDAGDMIQTVKEKRSIRLPARYLDSAVLAASEWVSPVITIDDDNSPKKCKRLSVESADKSKNGEEIAPKTTEPLNKVVVSTSSSSASSSSPSSSSSSSSVVSSSEDEESTPVDIPTKQAPPKKFQNSLKKAENRKKVNSSAVKKVDLPVLKKGNSPTLKKVDLPTLKKVDSPTLKKVDLPTLKKGDSPRLKKVDSPPTIKSAPKDKKSVANLKQTGVPSVPITKKKGSTPTALSSAPKKYALPTCSCKQSSRSSVYDYISKELYCLYCYEVQQKLIADASVSLNQETEALVKNQGLEYNSESESIYYKNKLTANVNIEPVSNKLENSSPVKKEMDSTKLLSPVKSENECKFMKVAHPSLLPSNSDSSSLQLTKQDKSIENLNSSSDVSKSNANNKYILLLAPVKTASGGTAIVGTPTAVSNPALSKPAASDSTKINKKFKPPILIRKTPTGFVSPQTASETSFLSPMNSVTGLKNTLQIRYPVKSQDLGSNVGNNTPQTAPLQLTKMTENVSSASQQITISSVVSSGVCSKVNAQNKAPPVVSNAVNSLTGSKVVTAYKFGDNIYLCSNSSLPSKDPNSSTLPGSKVAMPAFVQAQHTSGPIISSVQSVAQQNPPKCEDSEREILPNGLNKLLLVPKKSDEAPTSSSKSVLDDHIYTNKKPAKNRRKSPLLPKKCENDEIAAVSDSNDDEVDIETVESDFVAFDEVAPKKEAESDSEISDSECADIFTSSTDQLASNYSKRSISERKRRLLIKSGFENLKASSRHFKNAKSVKDILSMAQFVIAQCKKKDKINSLAKERLRIHNTMLLEKLTKLLEGIKSRKVRDKIKLHIINTLAIKQGREDKKAKDKKSVSIKAKESDINSKSERDEPGSEAPTIEIANSLPEDPVAETVPVLNSETPEESVEVPLMISEPQSSSPKGSSVFEEMKKKVKESMGKKKDETELNAIEKETAVGSKSDDDSIEICEASPKSPPKESPLKSTCQEIDLITPVKDKSPEKDYPGLIPLFHPKVFKENFSSSSDPIYSQNAEGSSQPLGKSHFRMSASDAADDDVSIIGSKLYVSPISASAHANESCSPTKNDCELTRAAEKANQLFGPCVVQKVQLKSGKTVFAYKTDAFGASQSGAAVGTRRSSSASDSSYNQNPSGAPEEIVISDSDEEADSNPRTQSRVVPVDNRGTQPHANDFNVDVATEEDSDSDNEALHIDESLTVDNSAL